MFKKLLFGCLIFLVAFKNSSLNAASLFPQESESAEKTLAIDSTKISSFNDKQLTAFYKNHQYKTAWLDKSEIRHSLLGKLDRCSENGLSTAALELNRLHQYETAIESLTESKLIDYDILLTLKLQQYVWQMGNGRLNPRQLYRDWDLDMNPIDVNGMLAKFETGDSLDVYFTQLQPQHATYKNLQKALQLLSSYPADTISCINVPRILNKNECDPSLIPIKRKLIYWKDLTTSDSLTATFDQPTFEAIKKFQARHGLRVDGAIGKATVDALNFSLRQRREQIIVNLERWKWFPRNFGNHYFIVNIPEYNLKVIKNNDTIETKRVVVGQTARKTAILSSVFNNIILNPTWTVPPTILEQDLLPAATKKKSYFASKNITIYNYYNQVVSPTSWNPEKFKTYRYVQAPGDDNSLGNVKFNFPNHYSVYLHDTNHRDYFSRTYRGLSSGCVRVENPLPLALYMLNDKKWNMDKICEVIFSKKTTVLPLKEKISIHQLYWTAWMDADGTLQFRQDIYNLDDELYEKLGN